MSEILTVKEAAEFLRVSQRLIYKNWRAYGGVKISSGCIRFYKQALFDLFKKGNNYDAISEENREMVLRLSVQGDKVSKSRVSEKERCKPGRTQDAGIAAGNDKKDRHGVLAAMRTIP